MSKINLGAARIMFPALGRTGFTGPRVCYAPDGSGDGGGGDAGGGDGGQSGGGEAGAFDWSGALGSDFDAFKPVIDGDNLSDPKAALAAYQGLKTKADGMLAIPGDGAKPEDWDAVYNRLGRPESPDKYDLSAFEAPKDVPWDGTVQTAMLGVFHKAGLNGAQVLAALDGYKQATARQVEARDAYAAQSADHAATALRQDWGDKYDANMDLANRAVREVFGAQLADARKIRLEDGRWLLDHPGLAKAFQLVGARMSEPGGLSGGMGGGKAESAMSTEDYLAKEVFK